MAKQVSKTVIGGFVISSIAILIAGVIIFGGGEIFKKTDTYVMFFESSVKGLKVGAPVVLQGVEIGSVSSIIINADRDKMSFNIPVMIEVDPSLMVVKGKMDRDRHKWADKLIAKGLRAKLGLESIVTGQMMIELALLPDTPVRLTGLEPRYPEIPTVESAFEQFADKLKKLPIEELFDKILHAIDNIDKVIGSPELMQIVRKLSEAGDNLNIVIKDADRLVNNVDGEVKNLSKGIHSTLSDAQKALNNASGNIQAVSDDIRKLLKNADTQIQPISNKVQSALVSARKAMDQAKTTLADVDEFVGQKSDTRHKLNQALDEISTAAKSLRSLMDYLERHPEALLKGKGGK